MKPVPFQITKQQIKKEVQDKKDLEKNKTENFFYLFLKKLIVCENKR